MRTNPRSTGSSVMKFCKADTCQDSATHRDYCQLHYDRWTNTGDPLKARTYNLVHKPPLSGEVSYRGAHGRCTTLWGSASQYPCVQCGETASDWAYDGTDETELVDGTGRRYSAWPEFYMPMDRSCHRLFDRARAAA